MLGRLSVVSAISISVAGAAWVLVFAATAILREGSGDDWTDAVATLWKEGAALAAVVYLSGLVMSGRKWARWVLAVPLAAGAAAILFAGLKTGGGPRADLVASAAWGLGAASLIGGRHVNTYLVFRRFKNQEKITGPLVSPADALRWIAILSGWRDAELAGKREYRAALARLRSWLANSDGSYQAERLEEVRDMIDRMRAPH